jgi:hypothetical protein
MAASNLAQLTFRETGDGWFSAFDPFKIERWAWVPGLEGLYEVSSFGRARSVGRLVIDSAGKHQIKPGVMLKLCADRRGQGYLHFNTPNTHLYRVYVHKAVAEAFLPPPPSPDYEVDHIDGDAKNNDVRNLAFVSRAEQMRRAKDRGVFHGATNPNRCPKQNPNYMKRLSVEEVVDLKADLMAGMVTQDASRKYGVSKTAVQDIKFGRTHHDAGLQYPLGPVEAISGRALSERMGNRGATGARGISIDHGRYRARIMVKGKSIAVGTYDTLDEAIAARKAAEKAHWG